MNRILAVLVNNKAGVLNRITGLFMRKGFNIQNITVGSTEVDDISRMTIVLSDADEQVVEQVTKQLHKQIDVLKVSDITDVPMMVRELALIRVSSTPERRATLATLIEPFRASIVDVGRETVTIQATGKPEKVDALIALLRPYGIRELARTGLTALARDVDPLADSQRMAKSAVLPL